ncbi:unnamed protein product [Caretta caretta]
MCFSPDLKVPFMEWSCWNPVISPADSITANMTKKPETMDNMTIVHVPGMASKNVWRLMFRLTKSLCSQVL